MVRFEKNFTGFVEHRKKLSVFFFCRPSKQPTLHDIRDPFDLPDGTPSFKDYTGSRNQRFVSPESASRNRIVRPTNVLHWFNAPASMAEERLKEVKHTRK